MGDGLATLTIRADFLRVAAARNKAVTPSLIVQAAPRLTQPDRDAAVRVGFTASRKVGNAVIRNRAKRRLRAVAGVILPRDGRAGTDYVLIARSSTAERPYAALVADLVAALRRVNQNAAGRRPGAAAEE